MFDLARTLWLPWTREPHPPQRPICPPPDDEGGLWLPWSRVPLRRPQAPAAVAGPEPAAEQPAGWIAVDGGPELAAAVGRLDPKVVNDYELVEMVKAAQRVASWADAIAYTAMAELGRRRPPTGRHDRGMVVGDGDEAVAVSEFAADEIGLALSISRTSAQTRLHHALDLTIRLPETLVALRRGKIDGVRARIISDQTSHLDTVTARKVEAKVLPAAGERSPASLRRQLVRAILSADPDVAARRAAEALASRRVVYYPLADGMGRIELTTLCWQAMACYQVVDEDARAAKAAGDPRPMDALRTDAFVGRVLGLRRSTQRDVSDVNIDALVSTEPDESGVADGEPEGEPGHARDAQPSRRRSGRYLIQVTVPISVLLGTSREPGYLAGHGPIPAEVARALAFDSDSVWHRLLTDPVSGTLLDYGTTVYRPPAPLRRHVNTRDQDCRLPVCAVPAHRTDFNHTVPHHLGGPTADYNGGPFCRHDHRLSQQPGWHVSQDMDTAIFTWTTPSGHTYQAYPAQLHPPTGEPPPRDDLPADEDPPPF